MMEVFSSFLNVYQFFVGVSCGHKQLQYVWLSERCWWPIYREPQQKSLKMRQSETICSDTVQMLVSSTVSYVRYQETEQDFQTQLTYDGFIGDVTESLSVIGAVEAAGKVVFNTLLHRVDLLLIWLFQHISIHFNLQKTLEAVCFFPLLKREKSRIITSGGYCHPHTFSASELVFQPSFICPWSDMQSIDPKVSIMLKLEKTIQDPHSGH